MNDTIRLAEQIHKFVRQELDWDESTKLLDEIIESREWVQYLEMEMLIHCIGMKKRANSAFCLSSSPGIALDEFPAPVRMMNKHNIEH